MKHEKGIVRDLAKAVLELAIQEKMEERRRLWEQHHHFVRGRVPLYIRDGNWSMEVIEPQCICLDPLFRDIELELRKRLFQNQLDDDFVIEPWISVQAVHILPKTGPWGMTHRVLDSGVQDGAKKFIPPIRNLDDLDSLVEPVHRIDEDATRIRQQRTEDILGDILEVDLVRSPHWWLWEADISTRLGYLRGLEQVMWDIHDHPDGLHRLLSFMKQGILKAHREAEEAGDIGLTAGCNQSVTYLEGLPRPKPNTPAKRNQLWGFMAAQEFSLISPEHHEEFMCAYQRPILEHFGAVAYGCCEDLSKKIGMLRKIKNLRRIAVSPFSPVRDMAEEIGKDYIVSFRPDPSRTVCMGFDREESTRILREARKAFEENGCFYDICLKDVHTVGHDKQRLVDFAKLARCIMEE